MQRPSQLILVRHGESERNVAKAGSTYYTDEAEFSHIKGIPDYQIELTEVGRQQAEATGRWLKEQYGQFDYAYHSGYSRTQQTLEGMLTAYTEEERNSTKVRMNQFIREREPGYTYEMTETQKQEYFPWLDDHWKTFGGWFSRPPGGESLADVSNRVYNFLNMLFRDRQGKKVLVVTHGGTLRCFRFLLERWTYEQALHWPEGNSPKNCSITSYNYDEKQGKLVLEQYNAVCPTISE